MLCKNEVILKTPIISFLYESVRGIPIIRAFNQQGTIIKRQSLAIDRMMLHELVHDAVFNWWSLRLVCLSQVFFVMTVIIIARHRLTSDPISLVLLLNMTENMAFMQFTLDMAMEFKRNCIEA